MASNDIGTAWIHIKPSLTGVKSSVEKEIDGASSSATKKMTSNFKGAFDGVGANLTSTFSGAFNKVNSMAKTLLVGGIGSAVGAMTAQLGSAISRADTLNNFPKIMQNLNISSEQSTAAIQKLSGGLQGLPTALDAGALGIQRFTTKTKDVDKATDWFLSLNNAILAGGAPMDAQNSALEQFTQMITVGKPDMMAWRSVIGAMPAQMDQLAVAMGYTSGAAGGDLYEAFLKGTVSADQLMDAMVKMNSEGGKDVLSFADQAKNATGGIATSFSVMKSAITRSVTGVMAEIPNFADSIKGVGQAFEGVMKGTMDPDEAGKKISAFFSGISGAIINTLAKLLPMILSTLIELVSSVTEQISKLLENEEQVNTVIDGMVKLFVAVAAASAKIAMALIPFIPQIIKSLADELMKPENAAPIAAAMGLMFAGTVVKTGLTNAFSNLGTFISGKLGGAAKGLAGTAEGIGGVGEAVKKLPKTFTFGESIANFVKQIGTIGSALGEALVAPFVGLAKGITSVGEAAGNPQFVIGLLAIVAAAGALWLAFQLLQPVIKGVIDLLAYALTNLLPPLGEFLLNTIIPAIAMLSLIIIDLTQGAVIPLVQVFGGIFLDTLDLIIGVIDSVGNAITNIVRAIGDGMSKVIDSVTRLLSSIGNQDWYGFGFNITRNLAAGLVDGLIDLLQTGINNVINAINNVTSKAGVNLPTIDLGGFKFGRASGFMHGGLVSGRVLPYDSVPAMLQAGESVNTRAEESYAQKVFKQMQKNGIDGASSNREINIVQTNNNYKGTDADRANNDLFWKMKMEGIR